MTCSYSVVKFPIPIVVPLQEAICEPWCWYMHTYKTGWFWTRANVRCAYSSTMHADGRSWPGCVQKYCVDGYLHYGCMVLDVVKPVPGTIPFHKPQTIPLKNTSTQAWPGVKRNIPSSHFIDLKLGDGGYYTYYTTSRQMVPINSAIIPWYDGSEKWECSCWKFVVT